MDPIAGRIGRVPRAGRNLIDEVRARLKGVADPARAAKMQSYMKSDMPYYGVNAPVQRAIYRDVFAAHPFESFEGWRSTALRLWREAEFREERYAAIELTGWRGYLKYQTLDALPLYEEMVVTGAWWDFVDTVAIHRIGDKLLPAFPRKMKPLIERWSRDSNLWKRRTSIISQVALKDGTDLPLLYRCIENNLDDKDFFIRKGIGWALRSRAWIDPGEISRYVERVGPRLSALSKREALKNIAR